MTSMELISKAEAKSLGLKHYFTGLACKRGHVSERLVCSKHCCACATERHQSAASKAAAAARRNSPERKAYMAAYRSTPERKAAQAAYRSTPEGKAYMAAYNSTSKVKAAAAARRKENPAAQAAICANRRAAKLQRTPKWADRSAIKAIYEHAAFMTRVCNEPFHVDHFYPLQGEFVSGLHVPANLRIITATENVRKSNKMPDEHFLQ